MLQRKKKITKEKSQEEENRDLDVDYCLMMARTKFGATEFECEFMQYGRWIDLFNTYKYIYNFETKQMLYADAEEETRRLAKEHQKIDNPLDL